MLTEKELRDAFISTNTSEPLAEGWPGLERFWRAVEKLIKDKEAHIADFDPAKWQGSLFEEDQNNSNGEDNMSDTRKPLLDSYIADKRATANKLHQEADNLEKLYIYTKRQKQTTDKKDLRSESDPNNLSSHTPGAKLDAGKPDCDLVFSGFAKALLEVAKVGTFGAAKYTDNGWKSVPNGIRRYRSAAYRHLLALEFLDKDSSLPHLAHAAWNCLAALELLMNAEHPENE